jgi:hypothetical protein
MTISLHLPAEQEAQVASLAAARGVSAEQVVAELVSAGLASPSQPPVDTERAAHRPRRTLSFAGVGSSGPAGGNIARRHRELLAADLAGKTARDA